MNAIESIAIPNEIKNSMEFHVSMHRKFKAFRVCEREVLCVCVCVYMCVFLCLFVCVWP